eukprot:5280631-Amphidinium_carterae.2
MRNTSCTVFKFVAYWTEIYGSTSSTKVYSYYCNRTCITAGVCLVPERGLLPCSIPPQGYMARRRFAFSEDLSFLGSPYLRRHSPTSSPRNETGTSNSHVGCRAQLPR